MMDKVDPKSTSISQFSSLPSFTALIHNCSFTLVHCNANTSLYCADTPLSVLHCTHAKENNILKPCAVWRMSSATIAQCRITITIQCNAVSRMHSAAEGGHRSTETTMNSNLAASDVREQEEGRKGTASPSSSSSSSSSLLSSSLLSTSSSSSSAALSHFFLFYHHQQLLV